jgi:hypothetical protein
MKTRITFTAAMLAGTFLAGNAWAATIEVRDGGSIQAAINKAGSGDTILVQPGTYSPFEANRNGITVKSAVPGGAHVIATGGNQPAIASYGQDNIAILDFRLTSKNGDGVKIGGSASRDARNIQFTGNTVESAAKDGLKFFQIKGMNLSNNTIKNAGTARNGNGDGGIDFVGVDNTVVKSNEIVKTFGHACFMMKGGSNGNTVTGNKFMGCERDGITVGGFTDANLMDSSDNGLEAHGNTVTGNEIQAGAGKCAFYYHKASNNTVSGNQTSGGRSGCSNSGGGGSVQLSNAGANSSGTTYEDGESTGESSGGGWDKASGETAQLVSGGDSGGLCDSTMANAASAAASAFGVISSITGRATAGLQVAQQIQLLAQTLCHTEEVDLQTDQLTEQRRMNASIGSNTAGSAGSISNGVSDTVKLNKDSDLGERYQNGASADMTPDESLSYFQELKANTDTARRNALETAAMNAAAEKEYAKMADDALTLSQSAQGPTAAQQAQTQMDRAREGAAASRISTQIAFDHARLMTEEEERAAERMGQQRRDRLYQSEETESPQPFKLFQ